MKEGIRKSAYAESEEKLIIEYIKECNGFHLVTGTKLWKQMEQVFEAKSSTKLRTWQSLKSHFKKMMENGTKIPTLTTDQVNAMRNMMLPEKVNASYMENARDGQNVDQGVVELVVDVHPAPADEVPSNSVSEDPPVAVEQEVAVETSAEVGKSQEGSVHLGGETNSIKGVWNHDNFVQDWLRTQLWKHDQIQETDMGLDLLPPPSTMDSMAVKVEPDYEPVHSTEPQSISMALPTKPAVINQQEVDIISISSSCESLNDVPKTQTGPKLGRNVVQGCLSTGEISKGTTNTGYRMYNRDEDRKLLQYIYKNKWESAIKGNEIYKIMVEKNVVANRTWQSLRQRSILLAKRGNKYQYLKDAVKSQVIQQETKAPASQSPVISPVLTNVETNVTIPPPSKSNQTRLTDFSFDKRVKSPIPQPTSTFHKARRKSTMTSDKQHSKSSSSHRTSSSPPTSDSSFVVTHRCGCRIIHCAKHVASGRHRRSKHTSDHSRRGDRSRHRPRNRRRVRSRRRKSSRSTDSVRDYSSYSSDRSVADKRKQGKQKRNQTTQTTVALHRQQLPESSSNTDVELAKRSHPNEQVTSNGITSPAKIATPAHTEAGKPKLKHAKKRKLFTQADS